MFNSYLKIAIRHLVKEKFFFSLNLLGLTAALTCTAFISLWIWDEWRHDRFFPNAGRIVRFVAKFSSDTEVFEQAVTSVPAGPALKNDFPEVEEFVRFDPFNAVVRVGDQQFAEDDLLTVDPSFFKVFNYQLKKGDIRTALDEPYTAVLTEELARKYFGDQDPIGQSFTMLQYDSTGLGASYRVTGVLDGEPRPAHFTFHMLVSFSTFFKANPEYLTAEGWDDNSYYTYLLLQPGTDPKALDAKLPAFFKKHLEPMFQKHSSSSRFEFSLQPLSDIYLHSDRRYEIGQNGNAANLYILATVGLLILLVAGINYVNMATALAVRRAKGVGVCKVLGAGRGQLAGQFLTESVLTAGAAAVLSLALSDLLQPIFERMTGKALGIFDIPVLPLLLLAGAGLFGLLAGIYPALVQTGFRPVSVLKGSPFALVHGLGVGGLNLRKSLVIAQFVVTIALIASVLVINGQMDFIKNKNLGFQKEALLALKTNGDQAVVQGIGSFRNELAAHPLVKGMTVANSLPVGGTGNNGALTVDNAGKSIQSSTYRFRVGYDYLDVFGIQLLAGRNFSPDFPSDLTDSTQNYLLNEAAVKSFGWETPEQAIGKPFRMSGRDGQVVGIVQDFHFNSLKHKVEPLAMHLTAHGFSQIILKLDMAQPEQAIAAVEAAWKKHFPSAYFEHAFVDEKLDTQYRSEIRFGALFEAFSLFSIFIACLGLFGLAAFTAERRTKEIGIRKVLGATTAGIVGLLSKDFMKLVAIALVIASPLAYFFMEKWLQDFAYRIDIQWTVFVLAGLLAVTVAFLTVSFQSVKAALANPVKSLRSE